MISKTPFLLFFLCFGSPKTSKIKPKRYTVCKKRGSAFFAKKNCIFQKLHQKITTQETLDLETRQKHKKHLQAALWKPFEKYFQKHEFRDPPPPVNLIKSEPESTCDFEADSGCANEASSREHPRTMRKQSRTIEKHSKTIQDRSRNMQEHSKRCTKTWSRNNPRAFIQEHPRNNPGTSQEQSSNNPRTIKEQSRNNPGTIQDHFRNIPEAIQGKSDDNPRTIQEQSKSNQGTIQEYLRNNPGTTQDNPGTIQEQSRNTPRTILANPRTIQE